MTTRDIGQTGEDQAATFLAAQGYQIIARNFSVKGGEIDLVARRKGVLVFVEVKKRKSMDYGGPLAAVTRTKQLRIFCAAVQFLKAKAPKFDSIRFDVVGILPDRVEHIANAFIPPRTTL